MDAIVEERLGTGQPIRFWPTAGGIIVVLAVELVFLTLGAAIGLSAFRPASDVTKGLGIGSIVWLIVTLCLSGFIGSWVGAAASGTLSARRGAQHGFVIWGGAWLLSAFFVGGAMSSVVSGVAAAVTEPQGAAGSAAQAASSIGLALWSLFVAMILSLITSLTGGAVGAGQNRSQLEPERRRAVRERLVPGAPPPTPA
jgi:hypothetical protein